MQRRFSSANLTAAAGVSVNSNLYNQKTWESANWGNLPSLVCLLCCDVPVVVHVSQRKKILRKVRSTVVLAPRLFCTLVARLFRLFRTLVEHQQALNQILGQKVRGPMCI